MTTGRVPADSERRKGDGQGTDSVEVNIGRAWQEVVVPADYTVRVRDWRIMVETCQVVGPSKRRIHAEKIVELEVELKEVSSCAGDALH